MRPTMDIHDLYPKRRQLVAWLRAGIIVNVESDGEIVALIKPVPEFSKKTSAHSKAVPGKRGK
jgi:hypothetical protein